MGYDEAIEFAKESVIRDLVSGKSFNGIGPMAKVLIIGLAQPACDNARFIKKVFTIPDGAFAEMRDRVQAKFVLDVLGVGEDRVDLMTAVETLVEAVWHFYIDIANQAE